MSCIPSPTATLFATRTTSTPSTSFSQSATDGAQVSTVVVQTCIASGTIGGLSIGCVSSAQVTALHTLGGAGQTVQVPIVVTVPVTQVQPTQTLFASCGGTTSPSSAASSTNTPLTSSVLVESTPPPTTVVEPSSTTLADGSVVQTVVTLVTTLPPTSLYVPTSLASPTLQTDTNSPSGSGTNVAPTVGGVLGGFIGLIAVVGFLWWLCRRRRAWDDIFEQDELRNEDAWTTTVPGLHERGGRRLTSSAEPKPYQYGLVGHVTPPAAAAEALRMSQYSLVSGHSGTHSRSTSFSATPLLQSVGSSRPSTAGSTQPLLSKPRQRVQSTAGNAEREPPSLSVASQSSSTRPLLDNRSTSWTPNMDELAVLEPLDRSGSPVSASRRRVLQIVNDGPPSPTDTVIPRTSTARPPSVIMHTDGGRIPENAATELDASPPAYSR